MMDNSEIILAELRELRTDFHENARKTGERLAALETSMRTLVGDTQPGRITLLENQVEKFATWKGKVIGMASGISVLATCGCWILTHVHLPSWLLGLLALLIR